MENKQGFNLLHTVNEIDVRQLLGELWASRWFIGIITVVFLAFGTMTAITKRPHYQTDALIQVNMQNNPLAGMGNIASLVSSVTYGEQHSSQADVESTLLQSRFVLGPVVEKLGLDISASQHHFPLIGRLWATPGAIKVSRLQVPPGWIGESLKIVKTSKTQYTVFDPNGQKLTVGTIGTLKKDKNNALFNIDITKLEGSVGTVYHATKHSEQTAITGLQSKLLIANANPTGQTSRHAQTGIMNVTLSDGSPTAVVTKLNTILDVAYKAGIQQQAEEAAKTLNFINRQIPIVKKSLQKAETSLSSYESKSGTMDMPIQSQMLLNQIVAVDNEIQQLKLKRTELSQNFTPKHPFIITLNKKIKQIQAREAVLEKKLKNLPEADKDAVSLLREVKSKNQLYMILLGKKQQLQVMKAGVMSNMKILAQAYTPPTILPVHKLLIMIISIILGLLLSSLIVTLKALFRQGVQDPEIIEQAFGLTAQAIVPHSRRQDEIEKAFKKGEKLETMVLARKTPKDISIESLRSLRTNLQLRLLETKNNIICLTGLAPNVGKSFLANNLAHVFADAGTRTLLIDGDLRKGKIHQTLNRSNTTGLTNFLNGHANLSDIIKVVEEDKLHFISRGPHVQNPAELLLNPRLGELFETLKSQYDVILIDTPPILALGDALNFASIAATNYLLISAGEHALREIKAGLDQFSNRNVAIDGMVFNFRHGKQSGAQYYYYGYRNKYYDAYTDTSS